MKKHFYVVLLLLGCNILRAQSALYTAATFELADPNKQIRELDSLNKEKYPFKRQTKIEYGSYDSLHPDRNIASIKIITTNKLSLTSKIVDEDYRHRILDSAVWLYDDHNNAVRITWYDTLGRVTMTNEYSFNTADKITSATFMDWSYSYTVDNGHKEQMTRFIRKRFNVVYNDGGLITDWKVETYWGIKHDEQRDKRSFEYKYVYDGHNNLTHIVAENDKHQKQSKVFTYSEKKRVLSETDYADTLKMETIINTYRSNGSYEIAENNYNHPEGNSRTVTDYDSLGNITARFNLLKVGHDTIENSTVFKMQYKYGKLMKRDETLRHGGESEVAHTTYIYNDAGDRTEEIMHGEEEHEGVSTTKWIYNAKHKVTEESAYKNESDEPLSMQTYSYYPDDTTLMETSWSISGRGGITTKYDKFGNVTSVFEGGDTGLRITIFKYEYWK